ncbi:MAG: hypothetical protein ABI091_05315 [Ferruginibacter sp.]
MSNEELMIPRYMVMIDFPQWSVFSHKKGDILELKGIHFVGKGTSKSINENEINKYPEIFKELHWSNERLNKDLPEYVKIVSGDKFIGEVGRVSAYRANTLIVYFKNGDAHFRPIFGCVPSTKEEYENQ